MQLGAALGRLPFRLRPGLLAAVRQPTAPGPPPASCFACPQVDCTGAEFKPQYCYHAKFAATKGSEGAPPHSEDVGIFCGPEPGKFAPFIN